ncbi:NAD(P)H dehydrogenase [Herbaspirillum hiltneri N3]|uniref:FMN dependent NADH:quinone oxidoreductase n=1 Tax=Herbaspirillum hiltneri N3 TaxID=1262470 RepID=A0ABM5V5I8_9BURK|nr:NAD(P)H-dependent oxidoreductase [Herbaspirillum hiltneri]AKZ64690.1 NAD(P)H dehydrogenase [Herbaspirillum hiltneri N3]
MNILHLSCSPRGQESESYRLSQKIISFLQSRTPALAVVRRNAAEGDVAHVDANYADVLGAAREPAGFSVEGSISRSEQLICELEQADAVLISTPMHNLTVPSALKAWIDHVVRIRRTFDVTPQGKIGTLRDRPVYIAVSSGGVYSGERARQPDFLTTYLKTILASIGLHDLHFFSVQGTAFGPHALAQARADADQALRKHFT